MSKRERELERKGYSYYKTYKDPEKAKEVAKNLRQSGYYAIVVESATNAIGYHEHDVYRKKKEERI